MPVAGGRVTSVRHPSHANGVDGETRLEPHFGELPASSISHPLASPLIPPSLSGDPLPRLSVLSVFASSPLRGEDNDGFAQQCRREVGVIFEQRDARTKVTPTSRGKIDFCEVQKSSRTVLPPQGGGGEKLKGSPVPLDGIIPPLRANESTPARQPTPATKTSPESDDWQGQSVVVRPIVPAAAISSRRPTHGGKRRLSIPVGIAAIVGALSFGVLTGFGGATRKPASVVVELDRMAELAGLGLNQVQLSGHRFTADAAIFEALELDRVRSLVSFNALAARERIEKLPWVETATMTRLLPDTLAITITERKPFAVWQLGDRETLIDAAGRRLGGIRSGGAPDLPRVAGAGAPDVSAELFAHLATYPEIASRLVMAERVGQRRWTLHLAGDLEVLLPANLDARPFKALQQMVGGRRLIDGGSGQLDLRHAERIIALPVSRPSRLASPQARVKQNS